jgi:transposase
MPIKKYRVELSEKQRKKLKSICRRGETKARTLNRARILLLANENRPKGAETDARIADLLDVSESTIGRVKRRFVSSGLEPAIGEKPRSGRPKKFTGTDRAKVTAIACSDPPQGRNKWSLRLIADRLVSLELIEEISYQTVKRVLKKTNSLLT